MQKQELDLIREIGWHRGKNRLYRAYYTLFKELQEVVRATVQELVSLYYSEPPP
ncbi:hypothetical protein ASPNIDRAFT_184174, partial [Aspergillus niger ATCC 1015]